SRRGFLIGAGSLLTTAFVSDVRSFIRRSSLPLLATPAEVAQTMYWYDSGDDGYMLSLGEWTTDPPPAPTWREFFVTRGIPHRTEAEIIKISEEHWIGPEDLNRPVSERYWHEHWELIESPCVKAYRLLDRTDI